MGAKVSCDVGGPSGQRPQKRHGRRLHWGQRAAGCMTPLHDSMHPNETPLVEHPAAPSPQQGSVPAQFLPFAARGGNFAAQPRTPPGDEAGRVCLGSCGRGQWGGAGPSDGPARGDGEEHGRDRGRMYNRRRHRNLQQQQQSHGPPPQALTPLPLTASSLELLERDSPIPFEPREFRDDEARSPPAQHYSAHSGKLAQHVGPTGKLLNGGGAGRSGGKRRLRDLVGGDGARDLDGLAEQDGADPEEGFELMLNPEKEWFLQQHRLVVDVLTLMGARSVLDLGCGVGRMLERLAKDTAIARAPGNTPSRPARGSVSAAYLRKSAKKGRQAAAAASESASVAASEAEANGSALRLGSAAAGQLRDGGEAEAGEKERPPRLALELLVGVDERAGALRVAQRRLDAACEHLQKMGESLGRSVPPPAIALLEGDIGCDETHTPGGWGGLTECDAALLLDVVEEGFAAESVGDAVLGELRPAVLLVSMPAPNHLYVEPAPGEDPLRAISKNLAAWPSKHFQLWARRLALDYEYNVSFVGLGRGPEPRGQLSPCEHSGQQPHSLSIELGYHEDGHFACDCLSQAAIFTRRAAPLAESGSSWPARLGFGFFKTVWANTTVPSSSRSGV